MNMSSLGATIYACNVMPAYTKATFLFEMSQIFESSAFMFYFKKH